MQVIQFTAEDLGLERPRYLEVAYAILEAFDGEPVKAATVGEMTGRSRKQVSCNIVTARKLGLVEMHETGSTAGYTPTEKVRRFKDEHDKRQRVEATGRLGRRSRGATGAA